MSDDQFLKDQIERLRRLTERVSQVQRGITENSQRILRDRESLPRGPLSAVRDLRNMSTGGAFADSAGPAGTDFTSSGQKPRRRELRGRGR